MSDLVIACLDVGSDEVRRECADVLYCALPRRPVDAWLLAGQVLERYPGCVLVLVRRVGGGCVVRDRFPGVTAGYAAALRDDPGPDR
jgi:hypothetical protein